MSVQFQFVDRETPMGANLVAGGATFRTWAPRAHSVCLLTGDALGQSATAGWTPDPADRLTPLGDGTWAGFLAGAAPGLQYLFWIDGEASQGPKRDPYARELTLTPAFPASYCILRDPAGYPWHDEAWRPPDFSKLVIYQLHVSTWWAVDATGADVRASRGGRFLDVATRLDYLRDLGVNAIQLLPIQEFETEFSEGYNGVDYFSPEQRYQAGSDADLAWYLAKINATLAGFGAGPLALDDLRPGVNQLKCLIDLAISRICTASLSSSISSTTMPEEASTRRASIFTTASPTAIRTTASTSPTRAGRADSCSPIGTPMSGNSSSTTPQRS